MLGSHNMIKIPDIKDEIPKQTTVIFLTFSNMDFQNEVGSIYIERWKERYWDLHDSRDKGRKQVALKSMYLTMLYSFHQ